MKAYVVTVGRALTYCAVAACSIDAVVQAMGLYPDATRISVRVMQ